MIVIEVFLVGCKEKRSPIVNMDDMGANCFKRSSDKIDSLSHYGISRRFYEQ